MATLTGISLQAVMRATPSKTEVTGRQSGSGPAINFALSWSATNGAGADAINTSYAAENTALAYGDSDDLDLYNGLTDVFGDTITQVRIRAFMVVNNGLAASIRVGAAAANQWYPFISGSGDYNIIPPGTATNPSAMMFIVPSATGLVVSNGSADTLRITHHSDVSDDASYQIAIFGAAT